MKKVINNVFFKRFLILIFLLFIYTIICAVSYVNAVSSNIESSVFRLHVIANSDSKEDQDLKYIVRDNILTYINEISKNASTKEEVIEIARNNIDTIKQIAQETVYENGYNYSVNIKIGNFAFPTKQYGDISLPAGFYDALRVEIGSASGQNWWCVMFPPLCFVDVSFGVVPEESKEVLQENLSYEEYNLLSENQNNSDMNFKFKIVELFQNIGIKLAQS
ncbi:MAG TPA: stage II sporulation protein R [Clostridiaceae bacterium]|nr:stage II sporulation protein R [Clostridiaceae bacterium]